MTHAYTKRLIRFGKIISAASAVVGAVALAFGATPLQIALMTVLLSIGILTFLDRKIVHQRISSAYVLIGLVAVTIVGVAFQDRLTSLLVSRALWKSTGIIDFTPNANDFLPRIRTLINEAREDIWFAGVSFYITLPNNQSYLLNALERGVNVRFLVYNPYSENLQDVARGFSQTPQELLSESELTIKNLAALSDKAQQRNARGKLEVRLFTVVPKMRLYVTDRHTERGVTFFIPHIDDRNTPNTPGFLARNLKTGVAPAFVEGLERAWNASTTWDEFLRTAPHSTKIN